MATVTTPTRAVAPTARFALTMDQLHLLQEHCQGVALPAEFFSSWSPELTDDERAWREREAEAGLIEQGLLAANAESTDTGDDADVSGTPLDEITDRVHDALRGFLSIFASPALLIDVRAWNNQRTIVQCTAVLRGYAVQLVRTQRLDEHGANPRNEELVELSAFDLPALVPELLRSLEVVNGERTPASTMASGSLLLPLTKAQGLIEAIRGGRPEIIEGAARELGHPEAVEIAREIAFGIDGGFTFAAQSPITGDAANRQWLLGSSGWFEIAVDLPLEGVGKSDASVIDIVDAGSVRVQSAAASAIVAQVTTAVATLTGGLRG